MSQKSVLITGSSMGGIGHALALAFQKRGLTVFATARSLKKMADLEPLDNVHLLTLDVSSPESIAAAAKEVERQTGGKLDILINNAGNQYVMPVLDVNIDTAKALFDVNYWGALRMVQAFGPMVVKAKGTIVNIGSGAGVIFLPFQSQYNATKAAMNALSETLRYEMMPLGVKVITLMAGNVKSNIEANREPLDLPPTSYYLPIKDSMAESADFTEMPTEKFAEGVVNDTLGGVSGYIWKGGNTGILRWLLPVLPWFVVDRLALINGKGINKMPKL